MTAPRSNSLIEVPELAALISGARPPTLLDVRWSLTGPPGVADYRAGHIPGAHYVDLDRELAAPPGRDGRHPLPPLPAFAQAMQRAGVRQSRAVIVYDAATSMAAARCWWLLRHGGHPDVRVLNGGLAAWASTGHAVETGLQPANVSDFTPTPGGMPVLDDPAAATDLARTGLLIDARSGERYRGEVEPIDRIAGHIPGAVSLPTTEHIDSSGRFREPDAIRNLAQRAGARDGVAVAAYCGSGVTAAHTVLALELAGIEAALYPGSWSQWISDSSRPVATGPDPG